MSDPLEGGIVPRANRSFQGAVPAQILVRNGYVIGHV